MIRIGIECESIEGRQWGVGRIVSKLIHALAGRPNLVRKHRFVLYFKSMPPPGPWHNNPLFEIHTLRQPLGLRSFVLYYYLFLPLRVWRDKLKCMFYPNYMLPFIQRGQTLVMLTEDVYDEMRSPAQNWKHRLAYRVFAMRAAKRASKIMALSESSARAMQRLFHIAPARMVICKPGIDVTGAPAEPLQPARILYVGQAFPRRHARETILAFREIAQKHTGAKLIVIGEDRYQPPCIAQLTTETNKILGYIAVEHFDYVTDEELQRQFQSATLFVYLSQREAFGFPPVEALAHGIPPVVCATPITRELFGHDAFFVNDPNNISEIADVLNTGLHNVGARQAIITGATRIRATYTWPGFCDAFLNAIQSII